MQTTICIITDLIRRMSLGSRTRWCARSFSARQRRLHPYGEQYSYVLSDEASRQISAYESSSRGAGPAKEMAAFESLARKLEQTDLKELEVASTIVFFLKQGDDWTAAVEKTRNFKNLPADTYFLEKCKALASEIIA